MRTQGGINWYTFRLSKTIVGILIILVTLCLSVIKLKDADTTIKKSKEYLEIVNNIAVEMTELSLHLQSLAFKYQEELRQLIPEAYRVGLPLPRMMIPSSQPSHVIEEELIYAQHLQELKQRLEVLNHHYEYSLSQTLEEFLKTSPAPPESLKENTEKLFGSITDFLGEAKYTIKEVKDALISSDPTSLKKPLSDLKGLNAKITELLGSPKRNNTWGMFP